MRDTSPHMCGTSLMCGTRPSAYRVHSLYDIRPRSSSSTYTSHTPPRHVPSRPITSRHVPGTNPSFRRTCVAPHVRVPFGVCTLAAVAPPCSGMRCLIRVIPAPSLDAARAALGVLLLARAPARTFLSFMSRRPTSKSSARSSR